MIEIKATIKYNDKIDKIEGSTSKLISQDPIGTSNSESSNL